MTTTPPPSSPTSEPQPFPFSGEKILMITTTSNKMKFLRKNENLDKFEKEEEAIILRKKGDKDTFFTLENTSKSDDEEITIIMQAESIKVFNKRERDDSDAAAATATAAATTATATAELILQRDGNKKENISFQEGVLTIGPIKKRQRKFPPNFPKKLKI